MPVNDPIYFDVSQHPWPSKETDDIWEYKVLVMWQDLKKLNKPMWSYLPVIGNTLAEEIDDELRAAYKKFPDVQPSLHHGYAGLKEEVDELWSAIKDQNSPASDIRKEAIQVAAMAIRLIKDNFNK